MKKSILLLIAVLIANISAFGQNRYSVAADNAFNKEYYTTAITKYKKAAKRTKKDRAEKARIYARLGDCYCMTNNTKKAEIQYKNAIKQKYALRDSTVLLKYGNALRFNGKYEEAKEQYKAFLEVSPGHPLAIAGLESCELAAQWLALPNNVEITSLKSINSKQDDFAPTWSDQSYNSIIFTSARDAAKGKNKDEWTGQKFSDLFMTKCDNKGKWTEPVPIDEDGIVNTTGNEGAATTNFRANRLYYTFCTDKEELFCGCKVYVAKRDGQNWNDPKEVVLSKDSTEILGQPALTSDELAIVFVSSRAGGQGGRDLYYATRKSSGSEFGTAINLGPLVNTKGNEMFPSFKNDTTLFFASDGHPGLGGLDIYYVILKNGIPQSLPNNVGSPLNTSNDDFGILFVPDADSGYFCSNRKGGRGGDDIYKFVIPPVEFTISGIVTDEKTLQKIEGVTVELTGTDGVTIQTRTNNRGEYNFTKNQIAKETTYDITVSKDDYFNSYGKETTLGHELSHNFIVNFTLTPIPQEPIVLPDILYDFAKWDLKEQYQDSLQGLIQTLDENPTFIIELASHTDMIGSIESNDVLSQKRAESVVAYLIDRGINSKRLIAKGYGERVPRKLQQDYVYKGYTFKAGTVLDEDFINGLGNKDLIDFANQLNRRTEFSIISKDFVPESSKIESIDELTQQGFINIIVDPNQNYVNYVMDKSNRMVSRCIVDGYTVDFEYSPNASKASISQKKAIEWLKKGIINIDDFEGDVTKIITDGNIAEQAVINMKTIRFGNKQIENVSVTVNSRQPYDFLFNDNVLNKVGMVILDKDNFMIIFE
jgi:peptidoglycan-associated lipoprotein